MTICLKCEKKLTSKNWFPSFRKKNEKMCKSCDAKRRIEYYAANKPKPDEVCKRGHKLIDWGRDKNGYCRACIKDRNLRREYGITLIEYKALWDFQKGKCAICGKKLRWQVGVPGFGHASETIGGRPELDHEHKGRTGFKADNRGILCGGRWAGCNRKLGRLDNILWLQNVLKYLQNPPARQIFIVPEDATNSTNKGTPVIKDTNENPSNRSTDSAVPVSDTSPETDCTIRSTEFDEEDWDGIGPGGGN